jgi:5-methyltetrahydrofolate--homocysteine methyltransferase
MTSAIMNPLHVEIVRPAWGGCHDGHDPDCARWIKRFREAPAMAAGGGVAAPAEGAARGRREGGMRRRNQAPQ